MFEIENVVKTQSELGESPRWDTDEQALYWLDIWDSPAVFRFAPATKAFTRWDPGLPVTGQARRAGGGFVLATRTGLYFWDERTGQSRFIHDPEAENRPVRFNDGSADRMGRFWAGSTHADDQFRPEGSLYRMDADCGVEKMAGGLACSNGLGWSPDNRTMYVTAQFAYELLAFDFDPVTGELANRRSFAVVPEADGLPDGLTVDAEGCVWSAQWGGWRLTRYDPDGKIERVVKLPVPNPTSCVFGGPDLKDLYVTTAWLLLTDAERQAAPGSGDLFVIHTDIQGLAEPKFAGVKMNAKQRYVAAARRQPVDRISTHFRASKVLTRRLMAYFGIDPAGGLAAAEALLAQLGADFWASGSRADAWATFLPSYRGPQPHPPHITDASYFYTLGIPVISSGTDAQGFEYPAFVDPPLARVERASDIPAGYLTQRLAHFDFDHMVNRQAGAPQAAGEPLSYEALAARDDHVICIGILNNLFMICSYLRGMEQFLMDLVLDRALTERLIGEVGEFCLEFNRRYLAAFGARAELYGAWDDVAGQDGMMFSPALFRRCFQPLYREMIAEVKRYGLIFSWHCCGSVHQVLPLMIDAGIDVLDVVQTSARDMDLETMYRRYGQDVCLSGGIDVQKLLVSGTPAQVRAEVRRAHDLWGTRGGLVLGPSHEAAPETPLNNILAIYEPV